MIGGKELATEPGRVAIRRRRERQEDRIRRNQERWARAAPVPEPRRICPSCRVPYPGISFCPACGAGIELERFVDDGPSPGSGRLDWLALSSTALLLLTAASFPWCLVSPYTVAPGVVGAAGLGVYGILRRRRFVRAIGERAVTARPTGGVRHLASSADTWIVIALLGTLLVVPPVLVRCSSARTPRRRVSRRPPTPDLAVQLARPSLGPASPDLPPLAAEPGELVCSPAAGWLVVSAPFPGGRDARLPVAVDGRVVGATPWGGAVDAGLARVRVGDQHHEVMVGESFAASLVEEQSVEPPGDWVRLPGGRYSMGLPGDPAKEPAGEVTGCTWLGSFCVDCCAEDLDPGDCECPGPPTAAEPFECDCSSHRVIRGGSYRSSLTAEYAEQPFFGPELGFRCAAEFDTMR